MTKLTRPDASTVQFSYDSNGNMTVLTNPSATNHGFAYNKVNNQSSYQTPISGSYSYVYDKDRRLKQTNFPSGAQISNIYTDNLLTQMQTPEGNIEYSYLCSSKVGSIKKGTEESLSYSYDGSLLTSESKSGTLNQVLEFTYNNDFDLSAITYAGGTENLSYDDDGLLTGIGTYSVTRNAANGLPEQVSGNALSRSRTFNGYGELTAENSTVNAQPVTGWSVTRNKNGKILSKTEIVNGSTVDYAYSYDDMGRLLTVHQDGTLVEEYQYGLNGSRTYEMNSLKSESGRTYSYSVEDHLLSAGGVSYQFDADGFLVSRTDGAEVTGYQYSSRGELLHVTLPDGKSIDYLHDPLGRRIAKKINGSIAEKYLWSGLTQLLAIYDGSDNLLMRFEHADGRMPVAMTAGGATYYLGYDQVGSLRTVADASGSVVKEISYDSFGAILSESNPALAVPFGFAGGLHDRDTGLVKFGFRDYDPAIGRWVAKDPIFFAGGDVDLYGYVVGDPVNLVDPDGLILDTAADIAFILWDIKNLIDDPCNRGENFTALGLDILGAVVPFATGLGRGYKLAKASQKYQITKASRKRFKKVIQNLSKPENPGLTQQKLDQLRRIADKANANVRVDLNGIKGTGVRPHAQVEGMGKSVESRHIWLQEGVK